MVIRKSTALKIKANQKIGKKIQEQVVLQEISFAQNTTYIKTMNTCGELAIQDIVLSFWCSKNHAFG